MQLTIPASSFDLVEVSAEGVVATAIGSPKPSTMDFQCPEGAIPMLRYISPQGMTLSGPMYWNGTDWANEMPAPQSGPPSDLTTGPPILLPPSDLTDLTQPPSTVSTSDLPPSTSETESSPPSSEASPAPESTEVPKETAPSSNGTDTSPKRRKGA